MPHSEFSHTGESLSEHLKETLVNHPEYENFKDFGNTVHWRLDRESKRALELVWQENFTPEDERTIGTLLDSGDFAKQTAALYLFSSARCISSSELNKKVSDFLQNIPENVRANLKYNFKHYDGDRAFEDWSTALDLIQKTRDKLEAPAPAPGEAAAHTHEAAPAIASARKRMLGTRKAVFATPDAESTARKLANVKLAADETRRQNEHFYGVIVSGSISKGYASAESDVDYIAITDDPDAHAAFAEKLGEKDVQQCAIACQRTEFGEVLPNIENPSGYFYLFRGLFAGDRNVLRNLQHQVVYAASSEEWEKLRVRVAGSETAFGKAIPRMGLSLEDVEKIKVAALLTRVPPPLDEAKKVIR